MLSTLLNSVSSQRILLFLFVNQTAYPCQIQQCLDTPLTPLQRGCERLEKGGVIKSFYEGKRRIYTFNTGYPLYQELQQLLKKGYTLLPPQEKKLYHCIAPSFTTAKEHINHKKETKYQLLELWERLKGVHRLTLSATQIAQPQLQDRQAQAEVSVESEGENTLIFREKGHWFLQEQEEMTFSNVFRWQLDLSCSLISLEHLRYGDQHPIFLFHLRRVKPYHLQACDPHLCADDCYGADLRWNRRTIDLHVRTIGPDKNTYLQYCYC